MDICGFVPEISFSLANANAKDMFNLEHFLGSIQVTTPAANNVFGSSL